MRYRYRFLLVAIQMAPSASQHQVTLYASQLLISKTGTTSLKFITSQESQMLRQCQMKMGNQSLGQILPHQRRSVLCSLMQGATISSGRERALTDLLGEVQRQHKSFKPHLGAGALI
jgi:hypothetical protein